MKRDREEFSKEETARRRDEVIRRMANTAPQHRASQPSERGNSSWRESEAPGEPLLAAAPNPAEKA